MANISELTDDQLYLIRQVLGYRQEHGEWPTSAWLFVRLKRERKLDLCRVSVQGAQAAATACGMRRESSGGAGLPRFVARQTW